MKKLIAGILDFRKNVLPHRLDMFAKLAKGQSPDVLFVTCSDSRVAPNWFASTDPGELFVVRNVGNLVPPCDHHGDLDSDHSVVAAIEFSLHNLKVSDIVICGHSGCGAIQAIHNGFENIPTSYLKNWLRHAQPAVSHEGLTLNFDARFSLEDQLSQYNVLQQVAHLKTYPLIQEKIKSNVLKVHAWWFEIGEGSVSAYDEKVQKFVPIQ